MKRADKRDRLTRSSLEQGLIALAIEEEAANVTIHEIKIRASMGNKGFSKTLFVVNGETAPNEQQGIIRLRLAAVQEKACVYS